MENVIVLDNNGKTFDRYTVIIEDIVFGMSHNPLHPQGVNQYAGTVKALGHDDIESFIEHMAEHGSERIDTITGDLLEAIKERMD